MSSGSFLPSRSKNYKSPVWQAEELFLESHLYFTEILKQIQQAQSTIDLEVYIFEIDELGQKIIESLTAAAARGVNIRVLVDAFGASSNLLELEKQFLNGKIQFKMFQRFFPLGFFNFFSRYNRRNHRKTFIFDKKMAFLGSANIIQNDWKEIGISITGIEVASLEQAFEKSWQFPQLFGNAHLIAKILRAANTKKHSLLRLNHSYLWRRYNYHSFLNKLSKAQDKIWIASAYFAPPFQTIRHLKMAAKRGVDVRVLVPQHSDVFFMPWLTATYYYGLLNSGVKVYEYLPRFYHAKVRVVDAWMIVGSSNLNHRSLLHDLEVDAVVTLPMNQEKLLTDLQRDFDSSQTITLERLKSVSRLQRLLSHFLLLFRYWL